MKSTIKFGRTLLSLFLIAALSVLNTPQTQALPDGETPICPPEDLPAGYSIARDTSICEGFPVCLEKGIEALNSSGFTRTWTAYRGSIDYDNVNNTTVILHTGEAYFVEVRRHTDLCVWRDTVYVEVQALAAIHFISDTVQVCTLGNVNLGNYIERITGSVQNGSYQWTMWPETMKVMVDTPDSYTYLSTGKIRNATIRPATFEPKFYKPYGKNVTEELVMDSNVIMHFRFRLTAAKNCLGIEVADTIAVMFTPQTHVTNLAATFSATACINDPLSTGDIFISGLHPTLSSTMYEDISEVRFSYNPELVTQDYSWGYNTYHTDSAWSLRLKYRHIGNRSQNVTYYDTVYARDIYGCETSAAYIVNFVGWPRITSNIVTICQGEAAAITLSYPSSGTVDWYNAKDNTLVATGNTVTLKPSETTTYLVNGLKANACYGLTDDQVTVKVNPKSDLHIREPEPYVKCIQTLAIDSVPNIERIEWRANGELVGEGFSLIHHLFESTTYTAKGISPDGCTSLDSVFILFCGRKVQTAIGKESLQRRSMDKKIINNLDGFR